MGTSESSRPEDREPHMTVVYSENLEADPFYARTVHVYLDGEVPNATYDRYSDPSRSKDRSVFIRKTIEKCNHTLPLDDPWKFSIPTTSTTEDTATTPISTTTHTATRTGTDTQISDTAPPEPANQSEPTEGTWNRVTHRKWRGGGGGTRGRGGRGRGSGGGITQTRVAAFKPQGVNVRLGTRLIHIMGSRTNRMFKEGLYKCTVR